MILLKGSEIYENRLKKLFVNLIQHLQINIETVCYTCSAIMDNTSISAFETCYWRNFL